MGFEGYLKIGFEVGFGFTPGVFDEPFGELEDPAQVGFGQAFSGQFKAGVKQEQDGQGGDGQADLELEALFVKKNPGSGGRAGRDPEDDPDRHHPVFVQDAGEIRHPGDGGHDQAGFDADQAQLVRKPDRIAIDDSGDGTGPKRKMQQKLLADKAEAGNIKRGYKTISDSNGAKAGLLNLFARKWPPPKTINKERMPPATVSSKRFSTKRPRGLSSSPGRNANKARSKPRSTKGTAKA